MIFIDRSSMRLARFGWAATLLFMGLTAGCGEEVVECFDDKTCGLNMRCNRAKFGDPGTCEACGTQEISYDGLDNDCSPRTPDFDLDGDGDNWVAAPTRKGTDCNDEDPTVRPGLPEICSDQKDNDCDLKVDEKDCGDRAPPTVNIVMPADNQLITGAFSLVVDATDDIGLTTLAIKVDGVEFMSRTLGEVVSTSATIEINSMIIREGLVELQVVVTDVAGGTASDMIIINVDNRSGPAINLIRPREARAYGGTMNIEAEISDPSGIATVEMFVDSASIRSFTSSTTLETFTHTIDTRTLSEGAHTFRIVSVEARPTTPVTTTMDVSFTVDNTPPAVTILTPAEGAQVSGVIRPRIEATDASGIFSISMEGTTGASPLEFNLDTATLPNGNRALLAVATDNAEVSGSTGNTASDSATVLIRNAAGGPVLMVAAPVAGGRVIGRTRVDATVTIQGTSTIDYVQARIDGEVVGWKGTRPYSFLVDFGRTPGPVSMVVEAVDSTGRVSSAIVDVTVQDPIVLELPSCFHAAGVGYEGFAAADITGDGILDVITGGTNGILLEGRILADGRWGLLRIVPLGRQWNARRVRVVDIDADGTLEVVVQFDDKVEVYHYSPTTSSLSMLTMVMGGAGAAMDLGDLDDDGDLDLFLDDQSTPGRILLWSNGTFVPAQTLSGRGGTLDAELSDVDQDGDLDLVLSQTVMTGQQPVALAFLNDGAAQLGLARQSLAPAGLQLISMGDVTMDGLPDLIAAAGDTGLVFAGLAASPGTFGAPDVYTRVSAGANLATAVADFDGDGRLDWAFAGTQASGAQVWLNPAGPQPYSPGAFSLAEGPRRLEVADMNGDGNVDLVTHSPADDDICIAFGDGGGKFYAPTVHGSPDLFAVGLGNLTGSGAPEVVLGGSTSLKVLEYFGGGDFTEVASLAFAESPSAVAIGDFDRLGLPDFAVAHSAGIDLFTASAGTYQGMSLIVGSNPKAVASADVDGDGVVELVAALAGANPPGGVVIEVPTGATRTPLPAGNSPRSLILANLDGDPAGTIDVGVINLSSANLALSTYGAGTWTTTLYGLPMAPTSGVAADFNEDGRMDFAVGYTDGVSVYYGDAALGFQVPIDFVLGVDVVGVAALDVNRDGRPDIVAGTTLDRSFIIINDPEADGFYPPFKFSTRLHSVDIKPGDLDGDGFEDLIIGHQSPIKAWTHLLSKEY